MKKDSIANTLPEPEFDIKPTVFSVSFHIRNNNKAPFESKIYSANCSGINDGLNNGIT